MNFLSPIEIENVTEFQFAPNNESLAYRTSANEMYSVIEDRNSLISSTCIAFSWITNTAILWGSGSGHLMVHDNTNEYNVDIAFEHKLFTRQWQKIVVHEERLLAITANEIAVISRDDGYSVTRIISFSSTVDDTITCAAIHPSGTAVALGSLRRKCVFIVDVAPGKRQDVKTQLSIGRSESPCLNVIPMPMYPVSVAWSKYGVQLALAARESVTLWNVASGDLDVIFSVKKISGISFISDSIIVLTSMDKIFMIDTDEGSILYEEEHESSSKSQIFQNNKEIFFLNKNSICRAQLINI